MGGVTAVTNHILTLVGDATPTPTWLDSAWTWSPAVSAGLGVGAAATALLMLWRDDASEGASQQ